MNTNYLFKRKRIIPTNLNEINTVLDSLKRRGVKLIEGDYVPNSLNTQAFYEIGMRFFRLTCKYEGLPTTFVFDLALGDEYEAKRQCSSGMDAFIKLRNCLGKENNKYLPKIVKDEDLVLGKNIDPFSTSPLLYHNETYNGTENNAYGYDMNSAYAFAMLGDMPDTRGFTNVGYVSWNKGIVEENQIGFDSVGELVPVGEWAMYRFPKMKSPFKKFVDKYYEMKKNAKTKAEKQKAKDVLNHSVGYFQRINPFIRSTIVSRVNQYIKSLIDEDTLYCNTDSIVSKRPRDDLKLGTDVGEWKLEHTGMFKYKDMNYQWNNEPPAYRGIPKSWFPKNYDILKDSLPINRNLFDFNEKCVRITVREDYEN